jgi:peptidylprolyl isomerase
MTNEGKTVKVHYTGQFTDGTVFDSSREREPLKITVGEGKLIPGFEETLIGMSIGEVTTVTIPPEKAYGPHYDQMVMKIPRTQLPEDLKPAIGQQVQMRGPDGQTAIALVSEVAEDSVTLDANHPLAGKELVFEIELIEIS